MLQPIRPAKPSPREVWLCPKCKEPMVLAIIKFGDTGELEERTLECKPCDVVLRSIAKSEVALRK